MKLYSSTQIESLPIVELLRPNFGAAGLERWTERYVVPKNKIVELTENAGESDAFIFVHNYNYLKSRHEYVKKFIEEAKKSGKKVIIFFPGDSNEAVPYENVIVFRNSQYKSKLNPNEIILPGYVADLGQGINISPRSKSDMPTVGFCGWAGYKSSAEQLKGLIKSLPVTLSSLVDPSAIVEQQGLWWRAKTLKRLAQSSQIKTNFIIRRSYSGNEKTLELSPEKARQEYVQNILESDFTLCIKGDGNFSTRFFEVLSLGRIPLVIDTDAPLPLENEIRYKEFSLIIPWNEEPNTVSIVNNFYQKITAEEFALMQTKARQAFENSLRLDSFLQFVFGSNFLQNLTKS